MAPLMYLVQGCFEKPQQTHVWNNIKFRTDEERAIFNRDSMLTIHGDPTICSGRWYSLGKIGIRIPIFHIPILGGWREYVVVAPQDPCVGLWCPGWWTPDVVGVSQLRSRGAVRLLRGPQDAQFFGVDGKGMQIRLKIVGYGRIGNHDPYAHLPLR